MQRSRIATSNPHPMPASMTKVQRKMARCALGLPNSQRRSYRNRYVAPYCPGVYDDWLRMEAAGLAERGAEVSGLVRFWLTPAGAALALDPGETLDPEDFPA